MNAPLRRRIRTTVLLTALLTGFAVAEAVAQVTVPGNYSTIQAAINAVPSGTTINVQPGTYRETLSIGNTARSITIRGTGGAAATIVDAAGFGAAALNVFQATGSIVIEGLTFRNGAPPDAAGGGFIINASSPAFVNCIFESNSANDGAGGAMVASNATFTGCTFRNNVARHFGGGVYIASGSRPVFVACDIVNNASGTGGAGVGNNGAGGGVFSLESSPIFRGGRISGNTSMFAAGGIFHFGVYGSAYGVSTLTVEDAEIADNVSVQFNSSENPSEGGGVHIEDNAAATLTRVRVLRNRANTGGGLNMYRGRYDLVDVAIEDNQAVPTPTLPNNSGWGGGIAAQTNYSGSEGRPGAVITMTRTSVRGNSAPYTGAGVAVFGDNFSSVTSSLTVQDSVITENQGQNQGGGILLNRVQASITNSIISRNSVTGGSLPSGGGIMAIRNSTLTITNSTVAGNVAGQYGGGVFVNEGTALTMSGSRVYDNTAGTDGGGGLFVGAATAPGTVQNSIIADNGQIQIVEHGSPCPMLNYHSNTITPRAGSTDVFAGSCGRATSISQFNAMPSGRASGNNSNTPRFVHYLAAPSSGVRFRLAWSVGRATSVTIGGVGTFTGTTGTTEVAPSASTTYTLTAAATSANGGNYSGVSAGVSVAAPPSAPRRGFVDGDMDGDGRADQTVYRPSAGTWYLRYSGSGATAAVQWGTSTDKPVAGDYDGDGRADIAVFRPSNGTWYLQFSSNGSAAAVAWGVSSDVPVPADYDGDGKTDIAVYRPSNGTWYLRFSVNGSAGAVQWGNWSDYATPGDYDGDGKADIAVFRPSTGTWYVRFSSTGGASALQWGASSDQPAAADYDGDGLTDLAVYRPAAGTWYIRYTRNGSSTAVQWGASSDVPVAADYDGDRLADLAVYRPSTGTWYVRYTRNGTSSTVQWGISSDTPIPNHF